MLLTAWQRNTIALEHHCSAGAGRWTGQPSQLVRAGAESTTTVVVVVVGIPLVLIQMGAEKQCAVQRNTKATT